MNGDPIESVNQSLPHWPKKICVFRKLMCLLGYHKIETRTFGTEYGGPYTEQKARSQCKYCNTGE